MRYLKRKNTAGHFLIMVFCCGVILLLHPTANAEETAAIGPNALLDYVVLLQTHSVSTTTTLNPPFDIAYQGATLIGSSNFRATVTRPNTEGEILFLTIFGIDFGNINDLRLLFDSDIIVTPKEGLSSAVTVFGLAYVNVVAILLFSLETEPGPMTLRLQF
jgi:hypothetical protein